MEGTCACAVRVSQRSGRIVMVLGESEIRQKLKLWQTPQGLLGGYRFLLARPASGPLVSSGGRKILSVTEFATSGLLGPSLGALTVSHSAPLQNSSHVAHFI